MITFDAVSRHAVKLDPPGFLAWLLPNLEPNWRFRRWLDPQSAPRPGEPDRRCDTIAELDDREQLNPPWAFVIELFTRPDPDALDRLLEYVGRFRRELRHGPKNQDRYSFGGGLVFLTGSRGATSHNWILPGHPDVCLAFGARSLAVTDENAVATLDAIRENRLGRCVLPWVPLMTGGDQAEVVTSWKELAKLEPNRAHRADYAVLAGIFASAAGCGSLWKKSLEGWGMEVSTIWDDMIEEAAEQRAEQKAEKKAEQLAEKKTERAAEILREDVLAALTARFPGELPASLTDRLRNESRLDVLSRCVGLAWTAPSLEAFQSGLDA
jgi:hypothetical protein